MSSLLGGARVRELLRSRDIRPSKSLGQSFVIDPNTVTKIVRLAEIGPSDSILEIGAGVGSLTLGLAGAAREVVALEKDERLAALLREVIEGAAVEVVTGDALKVDLGGFDATKSVSNLPYSVAARVVLKVLAEAPRITELTMMVQKEVGERLAASPGSKVYGASSVLVAAHAHASILGGVSRRAFWPVPNVDSVVVRLVRRPGPQDAGNLDEVVRAAFSQRRKSLRNSLASVAGGPDAAAAALTAAGLAPQARAEELGLAEFVSVGRALEDLR
ncbi:MAG: 16S rRNA (adenine(1518)-N(6)/adenine(1519)-N(6))-dimethyltransferase RsmA [Actinomycetota bacterium]|nr:16S rRNA (adenine(1518)-N(6)/adenine(1519)-N(6))-dimethyltransferase RsmA [Actinomycetota bacterium]